MDFDLANRYAEEVIQNNDEQRRKELIVMCFPYLMGVRKRFGLHSISLEEMRNELASDAVSDAIAIMRSRNLPFGICLQNVFRDICRDRIRIIREHDSNNIMEQCDIPIRGVLLGISTPYPPPPVQSEDNELIELTHGVLKDHDPFSRQIIYHKIRGSTYPEMAEIFETDKNECKRVYWHDINEIRGKLNPDPEKE